MKSRGRQELRNGGERQSQGWALEFGSCHGKNKQRSAGSLHPRHTSIMKGKEDRKKDKNIYIPLLLCKSIFFFFGKVSLESFWLQLGPLNSCPLCYRHGKQLDTFLFLTSITHWWISLPPPFFHIPPLRGPITLTTLGQMNVCRIPQESSVEIRLNHQPFIPFLLITGAAKLKLSNTTTQNILLLQKNASVGCTSPFNHAF